MKHIAQHKDSILSSTINPTYNDMSMTPWEKILAIIHLLDQQYKDDIQIYPGISEAVI